MLYDNEGRELDTINLLNQFYGLEPVDSLAQRYNITEEQVFEVIGGGAFVETAGAQYDFDFNSEPVTVTRRPYLHGAELRGDERPIRLLSILQWKPYLEMVLDLRGDGVPTFRTTSAAGRVTFR